MVTKKKRQSVHHDRRHSDESWIKSHWRPMMAWQYFVICLFDFLVAPIFFAWFSWFTKTAMAQWQPLTLQGGGLYHLAMGAIIGISSYSKSQERINIQSPMGQGQYGGNQFGSNSYGGNGYSNNSYGAYSQPQTQYQTPQNNVPIATKPRQTTQVIPANPDPEQ